MVKRLLSVVFWLLATRYPVTHAQELLFQQPAGPLTNYFIWASNFGSNTPASDFNYRGFDNFKPAKDSRINTVRWTGTIHDLVKTANNPPVLSGRQSWRIAIYEDQDGLPGSVLLEERVAYPAAIATPVANSTFRGYPIEIKEWSVPLTFPLQVRASRQYWLSIQLLTDTLTPQFSWFYSSQTGDGYYQYSYQTRGLALGKSDLAFAFDGTAGTTLGSIPTLRIIQGTAALTVSWLDPDRAYDLQSSPDLRADARWLPVDVGPAGVDGHRVLAIARPPGQLAEFFRLSRSR